MSVTRKLRALVDAESLTPELIKKRMIRDNLDWLLNKTACMFEYDNLPPSLPKIALERLLQWCGSCAVWLVPESHVPIGYGPSFNVDSCHGGNLFAFTYTFADAPDPYQEPYQVIITSPGFRPTISETLDINKDVVIIRNDTNYRGLYQLHHKYAELLAEAELSLRSTLVVLRDQLLFIAKTESQKRAVDAYIHSRELGEPGFIFSHDLGTPLETVAQNTHTNAVELAVNGLQAIKAAWYNEIGLNPSFSMKREYTSAQEIDTNTDLLMPIIDDMFESRKVGIDNVNKLFGTDITVRKSSAWEIKEQTVQLIKEQEEADIKLTVAQAEDVTTSVATVATNEGGEESVQSDEVNGESAIDKGNSD